MPTRLTFAILILAAIVIVAGAEVELVKGPFAALVLTAGAVTALVFSLSNGKVGEMAGNRGYATEEDDGLQQKFSRLTESEKDEIAQMVYDRLFVWAGRSIAKKFWLFLLALLFAGMAWLVKDHIR